MIRLTAGGAIVYFGFCWDETPPRWAAIDPVICHHDSGTVSGTKIEGRTLTCFSLTCLDPGRPEYPGDVAWRRRISFLLHKLSTKTGIIRLGCIVVLSADMHLYICIHTSVTRARRAVMRDEQVDGKAMLACTDGLRQQNILAYKSYLIGFSRKCLRIQ